jgi:hypothetical protein
MKAPVKTSRLALAAALIVSSASLAYASWGDNCNDCSDQKNEAIDNAGFTLGECVDACGPNNDESCTNACWFSYGLSVQNAYSEYSVCMQDCSMC